MPTLQRLRADHAAALLAFERENRAYFAAWIPDRGDEYFDRFDERHRALLELQDQGTDHFHVLVEADGSIVGRVNLFEVREDGSAELGYRIAERATGRGLATAPYGRSSSWRGRTGSPLFARGRRGRTSRRGPSSPRPASPRPARPRSSCGWLSIRSEPVRVGGDGRRTTWRSATKKPPTCGSTPSAGSPRSARTGSRT